MQLREREGNELGGKEIEKRKGEVLKWENDRKVRDGEGQVGKLKMSGREWIGRWEGWQEKMKRRGRHRGGR